MARATVRTHKRKTRSGGTTTVRTHTRGVRGAAPNTPAGPQGGKPGAPPAPSVQRPPRQITQVQYRPDMPAQSTQTAGGTPAPGVTSKAPDVDTSVLYGGDSPTGFDPITLGTY